MTQIVNALKQIKTNHPFLHELSGHVLYNGVSEALSSSLEVNIKKADNTLFQKKPNKHGITSLSCKGSPLQPIFLTVAALAVCLIKKFSAKNALTSLNYQNHSKVTTPLTTHMKREASWLINRNALPQVPLILKMIVVAKVFTLKKIKTNYPTPYELSGHVLSKGLSEIVSSFLKARIELLQKNPNKYNLPSLSNSDKDKLLKIIFLSATSLTVSIATKAFVKNTLLYLGYQNHSETTTPLYTSFQREAAWIVSRDLLSNVFYSHP